MGNQQGGILKKSPLGCIMAHWKDIGEPSGGSVSCKTLTKYCNQWWLLYKLEDGEKRPFEWNFEQEGKWDEVVYADRFFTLRNHPEWQKECGINLAPQHPMVLAIEKERNKQNEVLKRCCSACSIGQRCLKVGSHNERLEDVDAVFSEPEKQMVVRAARAQVQALVLAGTLAGTVDNHVPTTNPGWDPNQMGTRDLLVRYWEWIAYRIRNAVPKSIKQDKKESPTDFLNRLKERMQKYPTSQEAKSQLIFLFWGQLVDDIRRKLQKVQGADARDLERDSQKEKQMSKTIATANARVAALRTVEGQTPPWSNTNEGRGVMRSGASGANSLY
ncbi:hypothetical protein QYF61_027819 [Mycteria americana]|uniref:Core shell protein Gag P30 domain-containing protein n=1 Tax=Mycteria americana TaxID=33587 RepID=A0AAN7S082_MYCAM|nr:hypothetical protein QYF61_027818 [Mycteria americana]KAK4814846.1 hypothetical protein QYF61_027819 [Mycteria americana]